MKNRTIKLTESQLRDIIKENIMNLDDPSFLQESIEQYDEIAASEGATHYFDYDLLDEYGKVQIQPPGQDVVKLAALASGGIISQYGIDGVKAFVIDNDYGRRFDKKIVLVRFYGPKGVIGKMSRQAIRSVERRWYPPDFSVNYKSTKIGL